MADFRKCFLALLLLAVVTRILGLGCTETAKTALTSSIRANYEFSLASQLGHETTFLSTHSARLAETAAKTVKLC